MLLADRVVSDVKMDWYLRTCLLGAHEERRIHGGACPQLLQTKYSKMWAQ
jgi:hypothetical protein